MPTSTPTPTPSPTPFYTGVSVNAFYEYTDDMFGSFSGGTWQSSYGPVPHAVYSNINGNGSVTQLNAIALGGFNGLNN
jgi:hypothetical protein